MVPKPELQTLPVLTLKECQSLTAQDLSAHMASGGLEITVDGALSEWGSHVDEVFHKLEHDVLKWRADGATRTVLLRFVEAPSVGKPADSDGDVITFKAD